MEAARALVHDSKPGKKAVAECCKNLGIKQRSPDGKTRTLPQLLEELRRLVDASAAQPAGTAAEPPQPPRSVAGVTEGDDTKTSAEDIKFSSITPPQPSGSNAEEAQQTPMSVDDDIEFSSVSTCSHDETELVQGMASTMDARIHWMQTAWQTDTLAARARRFLRRCAKELRRKKGDRYGCNQKWHHLSKECSRGSL